MTRIESFDAVGARVGSPGGGYADGVREAPGSRRSGVGEVVREAVDRGWAVPGPRPRPLARAAGGRWGSSTTRGTRPGGVPVRGGSGRSTASMTRSGRPGRSGGAAPGVHPRGGQRRLGPVPPGGTCPGGQVTRRPLGAAGEVLVNGGTPLAPRSVRDPGPGTDRPRGARHGGGATRCWTRSPRGRRPFPLSRRPSRTSPGDRERAGGQRAERAPLGGAKSGSDGVHRTGQDVTVVGSSTVSRRSRSAS